MIQVRLAKKSEIGWINQRYDEVQFVHSNFDKETLAVAEWNEQKAGLGRLVTIDDNILELGGMYVFEEFRNKGVAREIVNFLLQCALPSQTIFCIPFEHLTPFYKQFGFDPCANTEMVPRELFEKFRWCKETYNQATTLLVKFANPKKSVF